MTESTRYDVAVIGGGIVGLAAARALLRRHTVSLVVLEAEQEIAAHQTGHNSGVIHSGIYYTPGSRKAVNCHRGRELMVEFCRQHEIPHELCGKLIVATDERECRVLHEIERRGRANGLTGIRRLRGEEIAELEPHVSGTFALHVPETGIVDFGRVAGVLARELTGTGAEVRTGFRLVEVEHRTGEFVLRSKAGELRAGNLLNCAGVQCDRVARACGVDPGLRIVPFRGEYFRLTPDKEHLVRNLVYPVPDPALPFLGAHLTRRIGGGIEAGPNAVLAFSRNGYRRRDVSLRDALSALTYPGFWRMASRHLGAGLGEMRRSIGRTGIARELRRLIPELTAGDLERHGAGVRAQAITPDGNLVDDFRVVRAERMLHVLNAPSPAATASLAIGETLAEQAEECFAL